MGLLGLASVANARLLPASQEPASPQAVSSEQLRAAIDQLGHLEYATRTAAARTIRRTPGAQAVPALLAAVAEHADGYVRYRALVLLTGFNDARTTDAMRQSLASPNDRLRAVAYGFFEHQPDPRLAPALLKALDAESSEFVRPALVRALAALGSDAAVQAALVREAGRGEDFFRGAVIEALGDHKAVYATDALVSMAALDGPLRGSSALALGKIGDPRALQPLAGLQPTLAQATQPFVAAALCLLGVDADGHERYLTETLQYAARTPGRQELLRSAVAGLGALGVAGRRSAVSALFESGIPAGDSTRAPVALALATIALRNTPLMMAMLTEQTGRAERLTLVAEGFEMLDEELVKERFFAFVRRAYWEAGEGTPTRGLMQTLIGRLDF